MPTDIQIINLGLAKLATKIQSISPPRSSLEQHCAMIYPIVRDRELSKGRWNFALTSATLERTAAAAFPNAKLSYEFKLPSDHFRIMRDKHSEWQQRGTFVYSGYDTLTVEYIRRVNEGDFHPLFVDVLACAIALESVRKVETSVTSKEDLRLDYARALRDARLNNAWVIGPEDLAEPDERVSYITGRWVV